MSLSKLGTPTSAVEVVDISAHGIWLLVGQTEHFLPFVEFPWFRNATVAAVLNVQAETPESFHWPDLDVDLSLESIRQPEQFPLKARQ